MPWNETRYGRELALEPPARLVARVPQELVHRRRARPVRRVLAPLAEQVAQRAREVGVLALDDLPQLAPLLLAQRVEPEQAVGDLQGGQPHEEQHRQESAEGAQDRGSEVSGRARARVEPA